MIDVGDSVFIQRCLQGDRDAFGALIRRYEHVAFGLALSYVQDFAVAEDLTQEAFISAYLNLQQLRNPNRFGPWLRTVVRNTCQNWRRSQKTETIPFDEMKEETMILKREDASPDRIYESKDLRAQILDAFGKLSEKNRQAVTLYYIHDLTVEEIGSFLDVSSSTINQRLHRARTQLKEEMMDMVEDIIHDSHPKAFPEKVIREISERAQNALKQHRRKDSVQHYNEVLDLLDGIEPSDEQMRWKADMLRERGHAVNFLRADSKKEMIADLEASLNVVQELGDRRKYAEHLMGLAGTYSNAREYEKSIRAYEEAAAIFESVGDESKCAACLYWISRRYIPYFAQDEGLDGDFDRALEGFRRAAEMFRQGDDASGEAMSLGAVGLLEEVGEDPGDDAVKAIGCGNMGIRRSTEVLTWRGQPGFCMSESKEKLPWGALTSLYNPDEFLCFPPKVGGERVYHTFAYGLEEMHATVRVVHLDAAVETPAGVFQNCLESETVFERSGEDPSKRYRRLNLHKSGTRRIWFAPGVGMVKMVWVHGDGLETEIQLMAYQISEKTKDYFPLQLGTRWDYRLTNTHSAYAVRDTCWVATQKEDMSYIAQFNYSEKLE